MQFSQILLIWLDTLKWMAGFTVVFMALERLMPCNPGMFWWKDRRAVKTDLFYWFIVPLFLRIFRLLMLFTGMAIVFGKMEPQEMSHFFMYGYGPLSRLPLLVQCVLILLTEDVFMYWMHRLFHTNAVWPFHAVHHSTKNLDWMSTQRFHPVNNLLQFTLADILALLAGFSPAAMVALGPFNIIYSAMVHANLNWTFGPLKYVFASPVFHRWHHTYPKEGGMKNFAPTFPFLDLMFGTFYMPKGKLPEVYGLYDADFPQDFWAQMVHPFRKLK